MSSDYGMMTNNLQNWLSRMTEIHETMARLTRILSRLASHAITAISYIIGDVGSDEWPTLDPGSPISPGSPIEPAGPWRWKN